MPESISLREFAKSIIMAELGILSGKKD